MQFKRIYPLVLTALVSLSACGQLGSLSRSRPVPVATLPIASGVVSVALSPGVALPIPIFFVEEPLPVASTPILPVQVEPAAPVDTGPLPPAWDIDVGPYETHARVEYFVERFRGSVKQTFELALERQSRYAPMIHERLRAGGLPEDMIFLPLIESWYDPHAYSVAAAVGMWQFMTTTAKGVGLRVDWWVDERRDPVRSTDAAVIYLNELRGSFGSTYLAAAAYNGGPGRITRGLTANAARFAGTVGDDLFFALYDDVRALRPETRDYVPKLIAAALVGKDPARYGVEARKVLSFRWDSVSVPAATPLAAVARAAGISVDTVLDYNPQILRGMTPPSGEPIWLRMPVGSTHRFSAVFAALPVADRAAVKRVVTVAGDFMTKIARAHGLTAGQLNWYNPQATRMSNGNLHPGQRILVPRADVVRAARAVPNPSIERYGASSSYTVKRGDNLGLIARKNGTTVASLRRLNRLQSDHIRIGQRLRIR